MVHIENWYLIDRDCCYSADIETKSYLQGTVFDHLHVDDGKFHLSSEVIAFDLQSKAAVTKNGSLYALGKMDLDYNLWLEEHLGSDIAA